MPIYDYNCPSCRHEFEARRGWNDDPAADCPNCGTAAVKQFAIPTVVYKGSGFYSTDHGSRSGSSGGASSTTSSDSTSTNGSGDSTASSSDSSSGSTKSESANGHSHTDGSHSH